LTTCGTRNKKYEATPNEKGERPMTAYSLLSGGRTKYNYMEIPPRLGEDKIPAEKGRRDVVIGFLTE